MSEPKVTIVVVPRERFDFAELALETLYQKTDLPFKLVYVDGNSRAPIKQYLEEQAKQKGFHLIRTKNFLSPNQARNLGLAHVKTKYAVIVDNDVLVESGWLENLVQCAEETEAWVVGPIYLEGKPEDQIIHMAGGQTHIYEQEGQRKLFVRLAFKKKRLPTVRSQLQRGPTEHVEFHCVLIRTDVFKKLPLLDEEIVSLPENVDLCLSVREAGGKIYFEPNSIVTYSTCGGTPPPATSADWPYFLLRWSDAWNRGSLEHFRRKWNLTKNDPYIQGQSKWITNHRRGIVLKPLMLPILLPILPKKLALKIIGLLDRAISFLVLLINSIYRPKFDLAQRTKKTMMAREFN
ncbi:MAG: glycosyltransferase [Xenococcaceae cyanobacterium MO_188.B32]|nr:glycosyltransferase [Xenococcaceae cyanobacterium MO_188.B32]